MAGDTLEAVSCTFTNESKRRLEMLVDYEIAELRFFLWLARRTRSTHMLDVGANIGAYTVAAARHCPGLQRLEAFEPAPAAFAELQRNLALQDESSRLVAHPIAASDSTGTARFDIFGDMHGANQLSGASGTHKEAHTTIEVQVGLLDDVVGASGLDLLMKIDVEGAELGVLRGASRLLTENRCYLQVEVLSAGHLTDVRTILGDLGYTPALHLRDDWYFVPEADGQLQRDMVERAFDDVAGQLDELRDLRLARRAFVRNVRQLRRENPELDTGLFARAMRTLRGAAPLLWDLSLSNSELPEPD